MSLPFVEVVTPEGMQFTVELSSERILVGSSPACQVLIDRPEFAREHLLLSPRPDGCYIALARGAPTPVMYNGVPVERMVVPWGAELFVGSVKLLLRNRDEVGAADGAVKTKKDEKPNPILLAAAVVGVAVLGYIMIGGDGGEGVSKPKGTPPTLFDSLDRTCESPDPDRARSAGNDYARRAAAKEERYPYRSQDGVEAVNLHANAAACLRVAGEAERSARELALATALKDTLERELLNHKFRLERAIELNRPDDGVVEVRLMINLLQHRQGDYISGLHNLERRLALQVDRAQARR
jgi:hypothetical protein